MRRAVRITSWAVLAGIGAVFLYGNYLEHGIGSVLLVLVILAAAYGAAL